MSVLAEEERGLTITSKGSRPQHNLSHHISCHSLAALYKTLDKVCHGSCCSIYSHTAHASTIIAASAL